MLKVFEAFAGYGSQRMALRNLGIEHEVVAISEIDKFAIASYEAIHGETNNLGDISKIDVQEIPDHDLFTYSFPCTNLSVAGKQAGFEKGSGTDSSLLWECQRVIDNKKPKYLLMENVKNLIGKKFMPGFQEWIMYLESLGYSNYWEVLNAKDFGIPQNRERVFMVSILGEHEPYVFPKPTKLEKRLKDVLEDEVDEKYYLDDERAQQLVATITDSNEIGYVPYKEGGKQHQSNTVYDKEKVAPTLNTMQGGNQQPQIIEPKIAASRGRNPENSSDRTKGAPTEQRLEVNEEGTSNTLTTVQKDNYVVELTAKEKFGRMGEQAVRTQNKLRLPHGETLNPWNEEQSSTNGVVPTLTTRPEGFKTAVLPVVEGTPIKNNTDQTLTADDSKGVVESEIKQFISENYKDAGDVSNLPKVVQAVGDRGNHSYSVKDISNTLPANAMSDRGQKVIEQSFRIRKLTPLECWRLMDVTDEDFYKAQAVNSNTQLYKQAGNSIVVSVLEAIFRNMFLEVPEEDLIGEHIPLF